MARPTGRPAGRPKKQPTFEPPGFKQAVRARFIEYARRHGSAALHLLATDVWRGEMTLDAWAKSSTSLGHGSRRGRKTCSTRGEKEYATRHRPCPNPAF